MIAKWKVHTNLWEHEQYEQFFWEEGEKIKHWTSLTGAILKSKTWEKKT